MTKIRRSLAFSMADTYVGLPLQIIGTMLMSRLLTPAETGVFAVAAVFAAFASTFRDFGVSEYLIQEKDLTDAKLRAALTVNIAISWTVGILLFVLAPLASDFYRHPGVGQVMRVQCLNFLLIPFGAVTLAYFRRELDFRPIFVASLLSNVATFVVALCTAYLGQAYMSLAWSSLAGVVVTVGTAMWYRPKHFPRWPGWAEVGPVLHFGKFASGVYIVGQLGRGAPEMIIGRAQGMADVAMFSRGGGLVELFNRLVLKGIMPVCQPYFAKGHREDGSIHQGYLLSMSLLTGLGWPALLFLGMASFPAIRLLYGVQWVNAADLAKVLCAAAAFELVHYLCKEALMAVGAAKEANSLQVKMQAVRVVGLLAVIPFGLWGACWGALVAAGLGLFFSQQVMRTTVALRWRDVCKACLPSLWVTLGTALPLAGLYIVAPPAESNFLWWLVLAGALTLIGWLVALRSAAHPAWPELVALVQRLSGRLRSSKASP
jgi:O-antigen/teichoic acid export membrane protein